MNSTDERKREVEALRERISSLSGAVLRISASLDVGTVLRETVDSARALTGARYGAITTIDEAGRPQDFVTSGRLCRRPGAVEDPAGDADAALPLELQVESDLLLAGPLPPGAGPGMETAGRASPAASLRRLLARHRLHDASDGLDHPLPLRRFPQELSEPWSTCSTWSEVRSMVVAIFFERVSGLETLVVIKRIVI